MREFFDKWARAKGQFAPTRDAARRFRARRAGVRRARKRSTRRSNASAAASATRRATSSPGIPAYLGPAALNRAWTLVNDVRDGARAERLAAVAGDAGCHACHTHTSCTERCPEAPLADGVDRRAEARERARGAARASCERTRFETRLWLAQRASAAVLALCVVVHLATMIVAVRGGLDRRRHSRPHARQRGVGGVLRRVRARRCGARADRPAHRRRRVAAVARTRSGSRLRCWSASRCSSSACARSRR